MNTTTASKPLINFNPNGETFAARLGITDQRAKNIANNVEALYNREAGPNSAQEIINTYTEANELCYAFFVAGERVEDINSVFSSLMEEDAPASGDDNDVELH